MLRAGSAVNIVATASPGVAEGRDTASRRSLAAAGSSSPDGVVRNLPAAFADPTFHLPVAPARAVLDLQDGPEKSKIARVTVLALAGVAESGRVIGVEPNTTVGGLLIDCEEDRTLRAVLVGMLREADHERGEVGALHIAPTLRPRRGDGLPCAKPPHSVRAAA